MSSNKQALIRYTALDKCFRDRSKIYNIENLLKSCNKAIKEFDLKSEGIKKRQLYDDISFMKSKPFSAPILNDKEKGYRYKDYNFSIFSANSKLKEEDIHGIIGDILILSNIEGIQQLNLFENLSSYLDNYNQGELDLPSLNFVALDSNEYLKGIQHFKVLHNNIINKKVLKISYKTFKGHLETHILHPYYLKQYNNRWFLLGKNPEFKSLTNLALDRIVSITELNEEPYQETTIDFKEYFEDVIGVTIPENSIIEKIEIYADSSIEGYIKTKPLHESQTPLREFEKGYKFSIEVIPNPELERVILGFGEKVKILSPEHLKNRIKTRLVESVKQYD
jgi:predicted DNA-binding transcriptional regulator YafY